jgi:hypothetical protein
MKNKKQRAEGSVKGQNNKKKKQGKEQEGNKHCAAFKGRER